MMRVKAVSKYSSLPFCKLSVMVSVTLLFSDRKYETKPFVAVLPRIKSKKPVTFVKQLHEVLVPLLDSAPLVDRPPFCATLVELIQAVRALGPDIIEVLGAAQSLLAATVLAIYRHVDLHLSLRAFQEKYPLITRGSPSFACVNEKDYLRQEQERSYIMVRCVE